MKTRAVPVWDRQTLMAFAGQLHLNLETLRNEVLHETYQPLPLLRVELEKPSGGLRLLSIPTVRDRVLQTAVTRVIEPLFEAEFEECSFAYRKGRSVEQALERIQSLQRRGYHWVVDADIQEFFDNIDHTLLMMEVSKLITDRWSVKADTAMATRHGSRWRPAVCDAQRRRPGFTACPVIIQSVFASSG